MNLESILENAKVRIEELKLEDMGKTTYFDSEVLREKAAVLFEDGKINSSLELFSETLYMNPYNIDALTSLGNMAENSGDLELALSYFSYISDHAFSNVILIDASIKTTILLKDAGNFSEAMAVIDDLIDDYPDEARCYEVKALILNDTGRNDEAEEMLLKAIDLFGENLNFMTYCNLASVYQDMGRMDEAIEYTAKALMVNPHSIDVLNKSGYLKMISGKSNEALNMWYRALDEKDNHNTPYVHANLQAYCVNQRIFAEAIVHGVEALDMLCSSFRVRDMELYNNVIGGMTDTFYLMGSMHGILDVVEDHMEENPENNLAGHFLAYLYDLVGDDDANNDVLIRLAKMQMQDPLFSERLIEFNNGNINEVRFDAGSRSSENHYLIKVVKADNEQGILNAYEECAMTRLVGDVMPKNKVGHSLLICEHDDGNLYHFLKRKNMPDVDSALKMGMSQEEYHKLMFEVIDNLAEFHAKMISHPDIFSKMFKKDKYYTFETDDVIVDGDILAYDHLQVFMDRVVSSKSYDEGLRLSDGEYRKGKDPSLDRLVKEYRKFSKSMKGGQLYVLHGDMTLKNALVDGTLIDFERKCLGNPMLDLALLLDDPYHSISDKKPFVDSYLSALNGQTYCTYTDKDMYQSFNSALFHQNMSFLGTALGRGNNEEAMIRYDKLVDQLPSLGMRGLERAFMEYMPSRMKKLDIKQ